MPGRRPMPPVSGSPPDDLPAHELPDEVPDPSAPGFPGPAPEVPTPGRTVLVASGREDRRRHVVEVAWGEVGDPTGLRGALRRPRRGGRPGPARGAGGLPRDVAAAGSATSSSPA